MARGHYPDIINKKVYDNAKMFSPSDELMCYTSIKKMNWYLDRNLATKIDNKSIRLNFNPNGLGQHGTPWLVSLSNICVNCGCPEVATLSVHHVIPWCFRRYFPSKWKDFRNYEVVFLCRKCHNIYESEAYKFTKNILEPLSGFQLMRDWQRMRKFSGTILTYSDSIPEDKLINMQDWMEKYLGTTLDSDCVIELMDAEMPNLYKMFADTISDYEEFNNMWKKHFIETMNPKFLPDFWHEEYQLNNVEQDKKSNAIL